MLGSTHARLRVALMGLFVLGATVAWAATAVAATPVRVAGHTITMDKKLNAALPPSLRSKGVVSVASAYPYPPWEYTKNGSMTGVEADLAKALGAKLGVKLQFHNVKFDGLIPGVIAGNYDVLIAAIHDTKDRQKQLTFIDEASVGSGFLVKKGNPNGIKDLASLCGKTVVVQASSAQVAYVNGFQSKCGSKGKITKLTLPDSAASVLAITTDKAQAYFSDKIALQYIADTTNKGKTVEVVSNTPKGYGVSPVGISVKKGNDKLANALKGAMQSLIDDGSYQAILDSYNFGFAALKKATINGATK